MTRARITIAPRRSVALFAILAILPNLPQGGFQRVRWDEVGSAVTLKQVADGKIGQEPWKEKCGELGIAGMLLCSRAAENTIET